MPPGTWKDVSGKGVAPPCALCLWIQTLEASDLACSIWESLLLTFRMLHKSFKGWRRGHHSTWRWLSTSSILASNHNLSPRTLNILPHCNHIVYDSEVFLLQSSSPNSFFCQLQFIHIPILCFNKYSMHNCYIPDIVLNAGNNVMNKLHNQHRHISSVQFISVTQSCLTLCDPMNCSTAGLPVYHQLPEFIQTHVHRVGDAIQPSHPLPSPSFPALNLSHH